MVVSEEMLGLEGVTAAPEFLELSPDNTAAFPLPWLTSSECSL
jgi:hypothetical protein